MGSRRTSTSTKKAIAARARSRAEVEQLVRAEAYLAFIRFPDLDVLAAAARTAKRARMTKLANLCRGLVRAENAVDVAYVALDRYLHPLDYRKPKKRKRG